MAGATIKDVAALAGVSIATVSNVFSLRKPVSPDIVQRVEDAANTLGYRKNMAASQLRTGRTRVLGVLVPSLTDTFFASLVSELERIAAEEDYQVLIASSRDDPRHEVAQLSALLGWRPSGIIAVPCTNDLPANLRQEFGRLPMVLVDRVGQDDLPVDTVVVDNYAAGRAAAAHLLDHEHRDIVIAVSVASIRPISERIRGIVDICRVRTGTAPRIVEIGSRAEEGGEALRQWFAANPVPSAVIAVTNVTTLAALTAFAQTRMEVPRAVSLVGFDDYPWMTARKVPLSAIRQPITEIAQASWDCLMARIDGSAAPAARIILDAPLNCRNSVAKPAQGLASVAHSGTETSL